MDYEVLLQGNIICMVGDVVAKSSATSLQLTMNLFSPPPKSKVEITSTCQQCMTIILSFLTKCHFIKRLIQNM